MGKWEMVRLGHAATFVNGFAFKPSDWTNKGLPIIRIQNLTGSSDVINYYNKPCGTQYEVNNGDILISWSASLGVYEWTKDKALLNQHIFKVVFNKLDFNKRFFMYVIEQKLREMSAVTHGSTMKHITKKFFNAILIPHPPLPVQRQIAGVLDRASALIEKRKTQMEMLDLLVKSRFIEMFGDPVSNPMGWKNKHLKDICTKLTDGTHFSPESYPYGDYKYITAKNIKLGGFNFSNLTYVESDVHNQIYSRCNPEYGDVLYIKDGVTTGIAMVNTLREPFTMLSSVALLKQDRSIATGEYLCGVLNNQQMYSFIRGNMGGAAITRLTISKLNNIMLPVPPLALQTQFTSFVQTVEVQKSRLQASLSQLEQNYKSLMQKCFRGEIF